MWRKQCLAEYTSTLKPHRSPCVEIYTSWESPSSSLDTAVWDVNDGWSQGSLRINLASSGKNVSFFLYDCIILYSLFPPLSTLNELKNKSKKLTWHKAIWSLLNLLSASELVWKGQNGILLETFCLQGWVCGKRRPQDGRMVCGRMKWEFRETVCFLQREEQTRNPPPAVGAEPFPGLWGDGIGLYSPFHSKK